MNHLKNIALLGFLGLGVSACYDDIEYITSSAGPDESGGVPDSEDPSDGLPCEQACSMGAEYCCIDETTEAYCAEAQPIPQQCDIGEFCEPSVGCTNCVDKCVPGDRRCGTFDVIQRCENTNQNEGCADWVDEEYCGDTNRSCQNPSEGVYECTNECGGTQVLQHAVCEQSEDIPCGVYYCAAPNSLVSDHVSCQVGGAPCSVDNECVSCVCGLDNKCQGNMTGVCPEAAQCL